MLSPPILLFFFFPKKYLVILDILDFHVSLRIKIYLPLFFPVTQRHDKPTLEKIFIYFLLHCVFLAVHGLLIAAHKLSLVVVHGLLIAVTPLAAEHRL